MEVVLMIITDTVIIYFFLMNIKFGFFLDLNPGV